MEQLTPLRRSQLFRNHIVDTIARVIDIAKVVYQWYYGHGELMHQMGMLDLLWRRGLRAETDQTLRVYNNEKLICTFVADMVVNEWLILQIKATNRPVEEANYEKQLVHYLTLTGRPLALRLDFSDDSLKVEAIYKRKPYTAEDVWPLNYPPLIAKRTKDNATKE